MNNIESIVIKILPFRFAFRFDRFKLQICLFFLCGFMVIGGDLEYIADGFCFVAFRIHIFYHLTYNKMIIKFEVMQGEEKISE